MPKTPDQKVIEQIEAGIVAMLEEKGRGLSFVNLEEIPGFSGNVTMFAGQVIAETAGRFGIIRNELF